MGSIQNSKSKLKSVDTIIPLKTQDGGFSLLVLLTLGSYNSLFRSCLVHYRCIASLPSSLDALDSSSPALCNSHYLFRQYHVSLDRERVK